MVKPPPPPPPPIIPMDPPPPIHRGPVRRDKATLISPSGKVNSTGSIRIVRPGEPAPAVHNNSWGFTNFPRPYKKPQKKKKTAPGSNSVSIVRQGDQSASSGSNAGQRVDDYSDLDFYPGPGYVPPPPPSPPGGDYQDLLGKKAKEKAVVSASPSKSPPSELALESGYGTALTPNNESDTIDEEDETGSGTTTGESEDEMTDTDQDPSQLIARLKKEVSTLKKANTALLNERSPPVPSGWVVLSKVRCQDQVEPTIYADTPSWRRFPNDVVHMEGNMLVSNIHLFKNQQVDKAFLVWHDYACDGHHKRSGSRTHETLEEEEKWFNTPPTPAKTTITILHHRLHVILNKMANWVGSDYWTWPKFADDEFDPPDRLMYHEAERVDEVIRTKFEKNDQQLLYLFRDYVASYYKEQSQRAQEHFDAGKFAIPDLEYLFTPGDVSIKEIDGYDRGYLQTGPLFIGRENQLDQDGFTVEGKDEYMFDAEFWKFDGEYVKENVTLKVGYEGGTLETRNILRAIDKLSVCPLKYASKEAVENLQERGKFHWDCRHQAYVSVNGKDFYGDEYFVSFILDYENRAADYSVAKHSFHD
ncbi:hypothetical protein CC78DRAFT_350970 [Lojkania enalia]|uniref:Uncharacterized protein n=1 Tax=Lojkania enalia TaxID=147567 RepID=A0A9P4KHB7_9PLEO|nr:hypothetical protein CC78DRAFT_350970 [Didymosphaeria enalia]